MLRWLAPSLLLLGMTHALSAAPPPEEFFERRIRPVLMGTCFKCHGQKKTEGGLRVDALGHLTRGGDRGPVIAPAKPERSLLMQAIRRTHPDLKMPPKEPLAESVVRDFETWIRMGAPWPDSPAVAQADGGLPGQDHWAYQPVIVREAPPVKKHAQRVRNDVDRYILGRLEREGLAPVAEAGRRTLIRRATFDLTGLPPTPQAVQAFVDDPAEDAYDKLIDRLLASPAYGERWGRHWLDVARYADTTGDGTDMPIPEAYRYRDYVIESFNADLPYDQFLIEQIAGDRLAFEGREHRFEQRIVATGYVALARRFGNSKLADFHLIVDNTLDTIGKGVLGMSLSCARCHDHKFDPISRDDYYGLYGYFKSTRYPHSGTEHAHARDGLVPLTRDRDLYEKASAYIEKRASLINKKRNKARRNDAEQIDKQLASERVDVELAWAVVDGEKTGDARMMIAGEPKRLGDVSPRGYIAHLDDRKPEIPEGESGRLALAQWIASPDNPLTARVMVNRIWMHHFGRGIVSTPNTFGTQGDPPSHPALLDWLADRFVKSGWSIKAMHRLMMTSATYRLSSDPSPEGLAKNPDNSLLWRFTRQRLDADAIRDAMLAVGGRLQAGPVGPHPFPAEIDTFGISQHNPFARDYDHEHRSVYLMARRLGKHPFMALFDGPDTNVAAAQRKTSTVPLQALYLMNSPFVKQQADALAKRVAREASSDPLRVERAYVLAFGRAPTAGERDEAVAYLGRYAQSLGAAVHSEHRPHAALTSLCRALLSSNEFLYVD